MLLLCATALTGSATGCVSSGSSPGKPPTAQHTTATATTPAVPLAVKLREAVVACRKQVKKLTDIPASEQLAAQADCNEIKTGHIGPLKAILLQACEGVAAKLPAADRPAGTAACKRTY